MRSATLALLFAIGCSEPEPEPLPTVPKAEEVIAQMQACAPGLKGGACRFRACAAWWSRVEAFEELLRTHTETWDKDPAHAGQRYSFHVPPGDTTGCFDRAVRARALSDLDALGHIWVPRDIPLEVLQEEPELFRYALSTAFEPDGVWFDALARAQRELGPTRVAAPLLPDVYQALLDADDEDRVTQAAMWMAIAWPPTGVPLAFQAAQARGPTDRDRFTFSVNVIRQLSHAEIAEPMLARSLEGVRERCEGRPPNEQPELTDDWLGLWCWFAALHPVPPPGTAPWEGR